MRLNHKLGPLKVLNQHLVVYPTPLNLNYSYSFGSMAGVVLGAQILTGILLAMHYTPHVDHAFASVVHLMQDVPNGIIIRYMHANGASLFFTVVYLHIFRGIYYSSGNQPRELVWVTGVVILLLMIITGFIGYVLPWGQMSFWGLPHWLNENSPICDLHAVRPSVIRGEGFLVWENVNIGESLLPFPWETEAFLIGGSRRVLSIKSVIGRHQRISASRISADVCRHIGKRDSSLTGVLTCPERRCFIDAPGGLMRFCLLTACRFISHYNIGDARILSGKRIGPHNYDILSAIFGSLLGDGYAEKRLNATRIHFQQESSNMEHLINTWKIMKKGGYCSDERPKIKDRLGENGARRYVCRFKTFSYASFNWIYESFYDNVNGVNIKKVPIVIEEFLSPLALAIWIMDDGTKQGEGLRISTNSFTKEDVLRLCHVLKKKYDIEGSPVISGYGRHTGLVQYGLYIHVNSMDKLRLIVKPFFVQSMLYKLGL